MLVWSPFLMQFAQHSMFGLHTPRPRQEEPSTKCHVEVVIIHTIDQISKFIWYCTSVLIQNSTTFTPTAVIGLCLNSHADCAHSKQSECLYHKVYIKSIVFFINLYKLVLSLPVLTVHDICPHLMVCLSFRVDFYWTHLSKKQESGNASLTSHVTNQIFN